MLRRLDGCACSPFVVALVCAISTIPSRAVADELSTMRFTDVTKASKIDFSMTSGRTPSKHLLEINGGGVAMLDYDNDGDLDLFFANGATLDDPERGPGVRLYANNGDGTFKDVTRNVGIDLRRWAMGVAVGDYDGDGCDDLYITCYGRNVLLRNVCSGVSARRFVDVTDKAGVADDRWGTSAAFADLDGDGDLDLYVVNYLEFNVDHPPVFGLRNFVGVPVMTGPAGLPPQGDVVYENLGDGTFVDITVRSGCAPAQAKYGLGVVVLDLDGDGTQDVFVGNDSVENFLFRNQGDGTFEEIGVVSGIASNADGGTQATMGIAIGDVDGNGHPDVFTTNFSGDTNTMHLNLDGLMFDDRTSQFGLAMVSRSFLSWGTGLFDFDSDGDEDLFIASGHIYPEAATHKMDTEYTQPPLLFERKGRRFGRNLEAGDMLRGRYGGRSCAFGDIDNDGDVDIVMTTLNGPVQVFRNDSPHRDVVVVELTGKGGNRHGLGSKVELVAGKTVQRRWIHGGSYQSVDAPAAYFGIGGSARKDDLSLRVTWPDARTDDYKPIPTNRRILITRGSLEFHTAPLRGHGG